MEKFDATTLDCSSIKFDQAIGLMSSVHQWSSHMKDSKNGAWCRLA